MNPAIHTTQHTSLATKEETASFFRTHSSTIDRWVKDGKISCVKIGARVLFDLNAILAENSKYSQKQTS